MSLAVVDVTLLPSVDLVAALVMTPVDTIFDLTEAGSDHLERCLARWPQAHVHTVQTVSASPRVTPIIGPPFAATPNWGAAPAARHGVLADIAKRRAAKSPAPERQAAAMTLDDYVQLEGTGPISLLLLSTTLAAVEALLGASVLLAGGGIDAVALLAPAPGTEAAEALDLLAGVLGKFDVAWAVLDAGPVSLAVRPEQGTARPHTWVELARNFDVLVSGVIRIGNDSAADLSARDDAGGGPLFLIDANPPALERRRQELADMRDITCIGAAISDAERTLTLHIDARGRRTYFATPDVYYRIHPKAHIEQFIEVTTCTLDGLAEKYQLAVANVLTLDLQGGELAALRGATQVLQHVDLVSVSIAGAPGPAADRDALDAHLSRHGFFAVPRRGPRDHTAEALVYVRKERLWKADPLAMIRRVLQRANVAMCAVEWQGSAAEAALRASPSLQEQIAFCGLRLTPRNAYGQSPEPDAGLDDVDVLVSGQEGLAAFQTLLTAALHSSRLCAIVLWGSLPAADVESATRVAFDHGFLLDRESAVRSARVFMRSSVIGDPARWLAANNAFGRRDFRFSALGRLGRFGNQLFQIMHLIMSSLRHDARASTCAWPLNEYFRLAFLEGTGQQGRTWEVAPGMWQVMAVWALEGLPDDIDYHAHLQWIAPFLSRHAAFINRCFDLKPAWAARARQMMAALKAGSTSLTAFHVRRTDYLSAVLENLWHQEIPIAWYRQALEARRESTIFAASDDLDYVQQMLPGFTLTSHRQLGDCGLPPLLIDHCVMRAADTLLMVNSTFSRTAGLLSATQTALLPQVREGAFAPYSPWHDPVFWSRFDDRYFADVEQHRESVERWLAAVGVPQLLAHEKPTEHTGLGWPNSG